MHRMGTRMAWLAAAGLLAAAGEAGAAGVAARRGGSPQGMMQGEAVHQQQVYQQQVYQQEILQKAEVQRVMHEQLLERQEDERGVVSLQQVWGMLGESSEIWMHLVDREIKALIIETYLIWYREQGIGISKAPIDYMLLLDSVALQNPELLSRPFQDVLMFLAVMEYDFDNGMNRDQLALQVLGPQLYEANKKRFMGP